MRIFSRRRDASVDDPDEPFDGVVEYGGRSVRYSTSGSRGDLAVVFLPLGVSRCFVVRKDLATSARKVGMRLVAVDRPGVGGTSPVDESLPTKTTSRSRTVEQRLRTHTSDVLQVLAHIGGGTPKVIGICAGTPYALHYVKTTFASHLTLVTPWVQPYDCEHAWPLARVASQRWFMGRSFAGYVLANVQLGVALPMLRSLEPTELLGLLDTKLTPKERLELQASRAKQANELLHHQTVVRTTSDSLDDDDVDDDNNNAMEDSKLEEPTTTTTKREIDIVFKNLDGEDDLERRVEAALGSRALTHIAENAKAHNVKAFTADVRVCLSSFDEVLGGTKLSEIPLEGATLFAGDDDDLVKPVAVKWLADRLPGNVGTLVYRQASHTGVQTLRRDDWLTAALTDGASLPDEDHAVRDLDDLFFHEETPVEESSSSSSSRRESPPTGSWLYRSVFGGVSSETTPPTTSTRSHADVVDAS